MKFTLCKKQYLYLALAFISLALAISSKALAAETAPVGNGQDAVAVPAQTATKPAGNVKLDVRTQDRIINLAHNVTGKMRAAINRMDQIMGRIDARIAIMKGQNVDTAEAEKALQSAKNSLQFAKDNLPTLDAIIIEGVSSENPIQAFIKIRTQFRAIRDAIQNTQKILVYTVTTLKAPSTQSTIESHTGSTSTTTN